MQGHEALVCLIWMSVARRVACLPSSGRFAEFPCKTEIINQTAVTGMMKLPKHASRTTLVLKVVLFKLGLPKCTSQTPA